MVICSNTLPGETMPEIRGWHEHPHTHPIGSGSMPHSHIHPNSGIHNHYHSTDVPYVFVDEPADEPVDINATAGIDTGIDEYGDIDPIDDEPESANLMYGYIYTCAYRRDQVLDIRVGSSKISIHACDASILIDLVRKTIEFLDSDSCEFSALSKYDDK